MTLAEASAVKTASWPIEAAAKGAYREATSRAAAKPKARKSVSLDRPTADGPTGRAFVDDCDTRSSGGIGDRTTIP